MTTLQLGLALLNESVLILARKALYRWKKLSSIDYRMEELSGAKGEKESRRAFRFRIGVVFIYFK